MSGKKVTIKAAEPRSDADKAKRVFRAALETIRRLDDISKQKRAYRDVFMPEAINLRSRLQDYCERLMFYDPVEYGRKAEELLWRKVYYEVIQLMKHNRKQMRLGSSLEGAFRTHLAAATGYYNHLLCKLQAEYCLILDGLVDFFYVPDPRAYQKPHQSKKGEPDPKMKDWARRACHRCLVYLGDVARYQQDYDGMRSKVMAQRHYYQALALCPEIGMPHNQLGTLTGSRYYNLDAGYYYLRCLLSSVSFDGAHGNLVRLFEKNQRRYQELSQVSPRDLPPEQQRSKDIKRFIVRVLYLLEIFHGKSVSVDAKGLQEVCQSALQDFNLLMFYQPPHVTSPANTSPEAYAQERLTFMEDEMVFKVMVICMVTIYILQKEGNKQVTAAIAFSLALFSHVLNHVVIRLQTALYELENPRKVLKVESADEKNVTTTDADEDFMDRRKHKNLRHDKEKGEKDENLAEKLDTEPRDPEEDRDRVDRRKKLKRLQQRRRRRRDTDSSSGSDDGGLSDEDSDLSEGETLEKTCGGGEEDLSEGESEDEVMEFLKKTDSSDSDSDDNLMVSQELRPGFSITSAGKGDVDAQAPGGGADSLSFSFSSNSAFFSDFRMMNSEHHQLQQQQQQQQPLAPMPDLSDILQEMPLDTMTSEHFFSQTLKFANLLHSGKELDNEQSDNDIKAVVQGKKEVRVPPGFEKSDETQHVMEITEQLLNFEIETDTDTSNFPTDTDNSTINTESEMDTETETESVIDRTELEQQRLMRLVKVISQEGLLTSIKVYCDWMRCNPHIIATCAKSSQSLWSRLSVLLNFLPLEADLAKIELCKSDGVVQMVAAAVERDWTPTQPLKEDVHLQQFVPLLDAHKNLAFESANKLDLTSQQEAILRICCLRRFGYTVSKMKSISFSFDVEKGMFYGPLQLQSQDEKAAQEKMADAEARRNQLMKDMAQLRLQAEVSQLEGSLQSQSQEHPNLPPYLVPDASALCDNLVQAKQLASCARFIIIIPLAVIDHLDVLKKESPGAREAIRWLESEFKKGNRYVRAQKSHERTTSLPLKNLKKKDKEAWRLMQIVDCSKYLAQQSSDCDPKGMVCILSSSSSNSPGTTLRVKQAITTAQQEGIAVQNAMDFHRKWKEVWKGGKG